MAKLEVFCTVNNCHYWDEGNRCGAEQILITLDKISRQFDSGGDNSGQIQSIISQAGPTPAGHSFETSCQTFRQRSEQPDDDGALYL